MFVLRKFQEEALRALCEPGNVICVAPTGSGKSLIFERQMATKGLRSLLVSPLTALARQQAARLGAVGINVCLGAGGAGGGGGVTPDENTQAWIISPEMLQYGTYETALRKWRPEFLVVDECHSLWEWGDGFRPAFLDLPELVSKHSISRSLWLTATLPREARLNLLARLPEPVNEIGEFGLPPELMIDCLHTPWPVRAEALYRTLKNSDGSGIVFAPTRAMTSRIGAIARAAGKSFVVYHAGMSTEERRAIETIVAHNKCDVVIATSAFGMGMDYEHLGWTVIWQAPHSMLSLAQYIGRAGRRGGGRATIFWDHEDFRLSDWVVAGSERKRRELGYVMDFFGRGTCRRAGIIMYFTGAPAACCGNLCDFCMSINC
ncbi:MAG: hypothetical protein A2583_07510 [Bdellovibrionales bacterium RIFOXYD1_FULL_53_11]|nr:MAG: hypothetical protein A2583_07510 [Bdellovibrionales bacterium RIFOXYD1_FULL_53_11]